jgi:hypothetical protein
MPSATIDIFTETPQTGEFALIIVEDGPWPDENSDWSNCLSRIQSRIYNAMDIAIDGHLAAKYPDAKGRRVRIQIDSPRGIPKRLMQLISNLRNLLDQEKNEYHIAIKQSKFTQGLRIVTGHEMGSFQS